MNFEKVTRLTLREICNHILTLSKNFKQHLPYFGLRMLKNQSALYLSPEEASKIYDFIQYLKISHKC